MLTCGIVFLLKLICFKMHVGKLFSVVTRPILHKYLIWCPNLLRIDPKKIPLPH